MADTEARGDDRNYENDPRNDIEKERDYNTTDTASDGLISCIFIILLAVLFSGIGLSIWWYVI